MAYKQTAKSNTNTKDNNVVKEYADIFIKALKEEKLPWSKGFSDTKPFNPLSGTEYSGFNYFRLQFSATAQNFEDPRWMTYPQAGCLGGYVKKGEKGTKIISPFNTLELDENNKPIPLMKDGKPVVDDEGKTVFQQRLAFKAITVFNVEQINNIELPPIQRPLYNITPNERFDSFIKNSGANVIFKTNLQSCHYNLGQDAIFMVPQENWKNPVEYMSTLLHEMGHWTGHQSRLARPMEGSFGSQSYAKEELVAEICASMMKSRLDIDKENLGVSDNNKAYIQSWIQALNNNPEEIVKACSAAYKVHEFLKQYDPVKDIVQEKIDLSDKEPDYSKTTASKVIAKTNEMVANKAIEMQATNTRTIIQNEPKDLVR
ncbi:zincin-like metallopeptidase domain-containing protein [Anaerobiospirillum sp. NML120511]|uniref:ArdC family protein n=1 Tax=Anaerobiospirillum sp. NML120511 TaxID=2932819 RepID=UPI001FF41B12|nr:zincin-like metallopeptidase domain-containing protein [Anaerobiospirillum sp. NML120511]MCK0535214.1 zincin-like metallopeptidase domain-containing protein [Anaerobiospirillum sp. NML120511]